MSETPSPSNKKPDQSTVPEAILDDNVATLSNDHNQRHKHIRRSKKEQDTLGALPYFKHHKKHKKKHAAKPSEITEVPHVMFQLGEQEETKQPPAFVELDELSYGEWREVARYDYPSLLFIQN
ncbi:unnamed protein product [Rodentolepis nana]|uniref:HMG box domain-containing protein n=1 Tax=Rodentolepis nana TaxID=102285 RepID=A0A0R3TGH2_RODNA|nr:unnamed protein product [Rodentolepis nana]